MPEGREDPDCEMYTNFGWHQGLCHKSHLRVICERRLAAGCRQAGERAIGEPLEGFAPLRRWCIRLPASGHRNPAFHRPRQLHGPLREQSVPTVLGRFEYLVCRGIVRFTDKTYRSRFDHTTGNAGKSFGEVVLAIQGLLAKQAGALRRAQRSKPRQ